MKNSALLTAGVSCLVCLGCTGPAAGPVEKTCPIKLGTFEGQRGNAVTDLQIYSPWDPGQYAHLAFPEHCWGRGLPNTSHNSGKLVGSPWRISDDSSAAVFERQPRDSVLFRARAAADSMAVRLSLEIVNSSGQPVNDIYALVCFKPDATVGLPPREDALAGFRDTSYRMTWFPVDGEPVQLHEGTHYRGDLPDRGWTDLRSNINWGVNVKGGPDNRTVSDIDWFRDKGPGRIVEEVADPALIAIHDRSDTTRWVGIIWEPARVLFCNPRHPCFHSDPALADCPAGGRSGAEGMIFFHHGPLAGLVERATAWRNRVRSVQRDGQ
ncbi:MAG: hypothetical protein JXQ83_02405 [Candidatus Glassbacteria bacterium]|nr:hypothetical protein [Candidatus Glassbacteria bacterium]